MLYGKNTPTKRGNNLLTNTKKLFQFTSREKETLGATISAQYGSLAFRYARFVFHNSRTLESVPDNVRESVTQVLDYVDKNGYDFVFQ